MSAWLAYLLIVGGIVISVLYPILRQALPAPSGGVAGMSGFLPRAWHAARPYVVLLLFAAITAPLVMAFLGDKVDSWPAALLAGFAWEATIEKVKKG
jgi:hypothetical protein